MRHLVKGMISTYAIIALLWLGGCASTLQWTADTLGVEVVSTETRQGAYKAASITFAAWNSVQKGALIYGKLPPCTSETAPSLLCRSDQAWAKIQSITHNTTLVLDASRPVIASGDSDIETLLALPSAVYDAQAAIEAAKKGD